MGRDYTAYILEMKKTAVGGIAPDFTQADTSGKMVLLKDFRGKYVLLEFWASWCAPCREESPNIVKAFNGFKGKTSLADRYPERQSWCLDTCKRPEVMGQCCCKAV